MSRTHRKNFNAYRHPKTAATRQAEYYAAQELRENGYVAPNRVLVRCNRWSEALPSSWDDIVCSAYFESWDWKGN